MKSAINLLICVFLVVCLVQAVAAADYTVKKVTVTPSTGDIVAGDTVTVHASIQVSTKDDPFPTDDSLEMTTELSEPRWEYSYTINTVDQAPQPVKNSARVILSGWELSYPNDVTVEVELTGKAPQRSSTEEIDVLKIQQLNSNRDPIKNSEYVKTATIVNTGDKESGIQVRETELSALRTAIDTKTADGVDTSAAEAKYKEAETAINTARTASYTTAQTELEKAGTLIEEGETLLAEAEATMCVSNAQARIDEVEEMITYFKDERNMGRDARVVSIETQLDNAQTLLTLAKDRQTSKDYTQAAVQATNAEEKASAALDAANTLREDIGEGLSLDPSGVTTYLIIGAVLIVLVVGGIVIYRRHTKWDELG
ncbi:MAG: hypothetical protein QCH35_09615 [Methanomicrobiaceae archaeon]|nr:hypothetical protein [Methanomicrobiaceae archaeon]